MSATRQSEMWYDSSVGTNREEANVKQQQWTEMDERPTIVVLGNAQVAAGVEASGGRAINLSPYDDKTADIIEEYLRGAGGLVLCGGSDIDPAIYGEKPHRETYGVSKVRDLVELISLDAAADLGVAILGICRGSQMLTAWAGGKLHQHVDDISRRNPVRHWGVSHHVESAEGSRLRAAWRSKAAWTTAFHHQAVARTGRLLKIAARADDGIIEAVESRSADRWWLGVQFHPEMDLRGRDQKYARRTFRALVRAAASHQGIELPNETSYTPPPAPKREAGTSYAVGSERASKPRSPRPKGGRLAPKQHVVPETVIHRGGQSFVASGKSADERRAAKLAGPVVTKYACFKCGIPEFDEVQDWSDHMLLFHPEQSTGASS